MYFYFKNESEIITRIFDLIEEFFKIFFTRGKFIKAAEEHSKLGFYEQPNVPFESYKDDAEDVKKINDLKESLLALHQQCDFSWIKEVTAEIRGHVRAVARMIGYIKNYSPIDYFDHFSDLKFFQHYADYGLIEHGDKKVLQDQLNKVLYEFAENSAVGTKVLAAKCILKGNTKFFYLPDYIRKLYADNAIELISKLRPLQEEKALARNLQLSRALYIRCSPLFPERTDSSYVHRICRNLLGACNTYHYNEVLFSVFHEICYEGWPQLFTSLILPI
jgi:hypothetical protein